MGERSGGAGDPRPAPRIDRIREAREATQRRLGGVIPQGEVAAPQVINTRETSRVDPNEQPLQPERSTAREVADRTLRAHGDLPTGGEPPLSAPKSEGQLDPAREGGQPPPKKEGPEEPTASSSSENESFLYEVRPGETMEQRTEIDGMLEAIGFSRGTPLRELSQEELLGAFKGMGTENSYNKPADCAVDILKELKEGNISALGMGELLIVVGSEARLAILEGIPTPEQRELALQSFENTVLGEMEEHSERYENVIALQDRLLTESDRLTKIFKEKQDSPPGVDKSDVRTDDGVDHKDGDKEHTDPSETEEEVQVAEDEMSAILEDIRRGSLDPIGLLSNAAILGGGIEIFGSQELIKLKSEVTTAIMAGDPEMRIELADYLRRELGMVTESDSNEERVQAVFLSKANNFVGFDQMFEELKPQFEDIEAVARSRNGKNLDPQLFDEQTLDGVQERIAKRIRVTSDLMLTEEEKSDPLGMAKGLISEYDKSRATMTLEEADNQRRRLVELLYLGEINRGEALRRELRSIGNTRERKNIKDALMDRIRVGDNEDLRNKWGLKPAAAGHAGKSLGQLGGDLFKGVKDRLTWKRTEKEVPAEQESASTDDVVDLAGAEDNPEAELTEEKIEEVGIIDKLVTTIIDKDFSTKKAKDMFESAKKIVEAGGLPRDEVAALHKSIEMAFQTDPQYASPKVSFSEVVLPQLEEAINAQDDAKVNAVIDTIQLLGLDKIGAVPALDSQALDQLRKASN